MSWLEIVAVVISAAGVWLMARRSLWCWPVALTGVALYSWIFFTAKLYSDMLLQGFFVAADFYGWLQWKRGADNGGAMVVAVPAWPELLSGVAGGAVGAVVLGAAMSRWTDAAAPWMDASLTSFSFVAQIWSGRRFIISWWLWITVDVFYIGLFIYKGLYPTAGLYALFMVLCFYGIADWRRAAHQNEGLAT